MAKRHPNMWKWLQLPALALILLAAFARLPEPLDSISSVLGAVLLLAYIGFSSWEDRRERRANQPGGVVISPRDQM
jgi:hypothetical protein